MNKVAIVTDSGVGIPFKYLSQMPIYIVPLELIWGDCSYRDGVDIQSEEFYSRLQKEKVLPTTSQAPPHSFKQLYTELLDQGFDVLSIHLSGQLSRTVRSALMARASISESRIAVFDTQSVSIGMGLIVAEAARAAVDGCGLQECYSFVEKSRENSHLFFVVDTLKYLHRGGRIGGAEAFVGTLLDFKPILEVRKGRVEAIERVRTRRKAFLRLLGIFDRIVEKSDSMTLAVGHANSLDMAEKVLKNLLKRVDPSKVQDAFIAEVGPVIGVHTGPGAFGIACLPH